MADDSDHKPTRLQRAKTISEIFSALVLPIVLAGVGYYFTTTRDVREQAMQTAQKDHEEQRQDFEKITQLMDRLTSANEAQKAMALIVLQNYASNCDLAKLIVPAVLYGIQDPNEQTRKAASEALGLAGDKCPQFKRDIDKAIASNTETRERVRTAAATVPAMAQFVPRVYIHIRDESQRPAAQTIEKALESKGFTVPGIQKVNTGPNKTEVRFFRSSEEDLARSAVAALPISGVDANYVKGYENSQGIRPRHYELWLAPGPIIFKREGPNESSNAEGSAAEATP